MSDPESAADPPRVPRSVLVVGAGLAATRTVAELRERGFDGRIVVLGAEPVAPYDRPPLSKHLLDRPGTTWLRDEIGGDLLTLADEVHLATPARGLSLTNNGSGNGTDARVGVLADDGTRHADALVVATGAHAVRPPGWESALTLHTVADAAVLRSALTPGTRLVVIGAGWIGAEVAGVAAAAGVDVVVLEATADPLGAALGPIVGALTAPWYGAAGVRLLTGTRVVEVRDGGVRLADGRFVPADVVLAAVGARPSTAWLADALPREPDGSLRVDAGHTVLDARHAVVGAQRWVRAVGDVALRRSTRHGWVPGGHWDGALRGPIALVADLLGQDAGIDPAPYVFSTQLGHELALFGIRHADDEVVLRGDPASGDGWAALWFRPGGDEVSAILTVDRPRDVGAARRLFTATGLPTLDRTRVREPAISLGDTTIAARDDPRA